MEKSENIYPSLSPQLSVFRPLLILQGPTHSSCLFFEKGAKQAPSGRAEEQVIGATHMVTSARLVLLSSFTLTYNRYHRAPPDMHVIIAMTSPAAALLRPRPSRVMPSPAWFGTEHARLSMHELKPVTQPYFTQTTAVHKRAFMTVSKWVKFTNCP